jgi:hypothetical protein
MQSSPTFDLAGFVCWIFRVGKYNVVPLCSNIRNLYSLATNQIYLLHGGRGLKTPPENMPVNGV